MRWSGSSRGTDHFYLLFTAPVSGLRSRLYARFASLRPLRSPNAWDNLKWHQNKGNLQLNFFLSIIFVGMILNGCESPPPRCQPFLFVDAKS